MQAATRAWSIGSRDWGLEASGFDPSLVGESPGEVMAGEGGDTVSKEEEESMANEKDESVGRTPVTGEPVNVEEARKEAAKEKIREKVRERVEELSEIVRKKHGPPGTP